MAQGKGMRCCSSCQPVCKALPAPLPEALNQKPKTTCIACCASAAGGRHAGAAAAAGRHAPQPVCREQRWPAPEQGPVQRT